MFCTVSGKPVFSFICSCHAYMYITQDFVNVFRCCLDIPDFSRLFLIYSSQSTFSGSYMYTPVFALNFIWSKFTVQTFYTLRYGLYFVYSLDIRVPRYQKSFVLNFLFSLLHVYSCACSYLIIYPERFQGKLHLTQNIWK